MTDANPEHTFGHTIAFGEEYYQKAVEILRAVGDDTLIGETLNWRFGNID